LLNGIAVYQGMRPCVQTLLQYQHVIDSINYTTPFLQELRNDPQLAEYLEDGTLPFDDTRAWKMALQDSLFAIVGSTLDHKRQNTVASK